MYYGKTYAMVPTFRMYYRALGGTKAQAEQVSEAVSGWSRFFIRDLGKNPPTKVQHFIADALGCDRMEVR